MDKKLATPIPLTSEGNYRPDHLYKWLLEAMDEGKSAVEISQELCVPMDRVVYITGNGLPFLRRRGFAYAAQRRHNSEQKEKCLE